MIVIWRFGGRVVFFKIVSRLKRVSEKQFALACLAVTPVFLVLGLGFWAGFAFGVWLCFKFRPAPVEREPIRLE